MKSDALKILNEVSAEQPKDRGRVTLYLSRSAFYEFQKACGDAKPSRVIEKLIRSFTSAKKTA